MRKLLPLILALLLLFSACGGQETPATEPVQPVPDDISTPSAMALAVEIIADSGRDADSLWFVNGSYESADLISYIEHYYGLASEAWDECAIYRAEGADAFEVSIFKLTEQADTRSVYDCLEDYRFGRQGDFYGYDPEQEAQVADAKITVTDDGWAAVLICPDALRAEEKFCALLGGAVQLEKPVEEAEEEEEAQQPLGDLPSYWLPYVDPENDDMTLWDNTAMVAALKAGDDSGLSAKDKKLYEKVRQVLETEIRADMTPIEKEVAIYIWLGENAGYDYRHYEVPNAAPRDSYEPYGAILEGKAVCLGFATAFQLFMDVLDIECITVVGAAFNSMEDHAWNMVRIDGAWYCVDSTWDEAQPRYGVYFNRSSDVFAMSDHQWDYVAYPIADADWVF